MLAFEALYARGEMALQALLRAEHPAEQAAERAWRLLRDVRSGERRRRRCGFSGKGIYRAKLGAHPVRGCAKYERAEDGDERKAKGPPRQDGASLHLTVTVWANWEPKLLFGPS